MAYRQPGVTVIQNFVNALPALASFALPSVSVGPAYQVVTQQSAGNYDGSADVYDYPNQIEGTYIDERLLDSTDLTSFPVSIFLSNTIIQLLEASTGVVVGTNLNQFTDPTTGVFTNVAAGDVITVTGSGLGNNGSYTVRSFVNVNTLQVNETFAAPETGMSYFISRNISSQLNPTIQIPVSTAGLSYDQEGVSLPAALTTAYAPFGTVPILSAGVLISYRAQRFEQSAQVVDYNGTTGITDLEAFYGLDQIVPQNTVVFAAYVALLNSPTDTNLLGLPETYLNTGEGEGDELLAYSTALEILALTSMYAISVLTQKIAVHEALSAHVTTYSEPAEKLERVGIVNRQIVLTASLTSNAADGTIDTTGLIFNSPSGEFITDGVVPGTFLNIVTPTPAAGRYLVAAVNSQTQLLLAPAAPVPGGPLTGVTFFMDYNLSLDQQASTMAAYASSLGNRRIVMTWPDVVTFPVNNVVVPLPGYYLNSSVIALTTGLPTQQGLTNLSVVGYAGVVHSTQYFSNDQLNTLAAGGVMIFVQDVLNQTELFIRHQLTTDLSAIKFQEYSVTKNVDFIAKFIRANSQQFIGQYNIVDSTFDDLKTSATGMIGYLSTGTVQAKIGGVIRSGTLNSIIQDPANIDGILETWTLDIPIPLNNLDITINV